MGQTLTNGIYLPDEGERNSYSGLEANWRTLDALILTVNGKAAPNIANTWTAAQTFTAGIIGDLTGNVTGNVTGDLTGTASRAIADEDGTSIKTGYVNVAGNQTVSGNKEFTGSNTFNSILPNATNTYSLGSSSYQWSSVYAQSYYYNGTQWGLDQPNTWSNINNFQREITLAGDRNAYVAPMWTGVGSGIAFLTQDASKGFYWGSYTNDANNRKVLDTAKGNLRIYAGESGSGTMVAVEPINAVNSQLGTSTNKWKTLNGVNPGALSLPNSPGGSGTVNINYIDLSGDITIRDASSANFYTAICDGWIAINSYATLIQIADDTTLVCVTGAIGADGFGQCYLPVRKNDSLRIVINQTNTNFQSFKLIPCQGNV